MNLTKEVKALHSENQKTQMKEIEKDTNKWKDSQFKYTQFNYNYFLTIFQVVSGRGNLNCLGRKAVILTNALSNLT